MANEVTYTQSPFNKARKDKFLLVITIPKPLRKIISKFERDENLIIPDTLQFSVYGSIIPSIEIAPQNVRYAGQTLSVSTHSRSVYEPNTVNFTIDNRFNNYWVIYKWLGLLNHDETGIYDNDKLTQRTQGGDRVNDRSNPNMEYRCDITIYALDEYNKRIVEFLYTDAFPTALGGINYNYRDSGEIETSFTYSFSQFIVRPVTSLTESL